MKFVSADYIVGVEFPAYEWELIKKALQIMVLPHPSDEIDAMTSSETQAMELLLLSMRSVVTPE